MLKPLAPKSGPELKDTDITHDIIRCAIEVHKTIGGPGVLEKVYQRALAYELHCAGHKAEVEVPCPIVYKGHDLSGPEHPLRIDLLVDDRIVVECKAAKYNPLFAAQCLTYLRLKKLKTGLVINFGLPKLIDGVERIVNDAREIVSMIPCQVAESREAPLSANSPRRP